MLSARRPRRSYSPSCEKKHTKNKPNSNTVAENATVAVEIEPPPAASAPEVEPQTELARNSPPRRRIRHRQRPTNGGRGGKRPDRPPPPPTADKKQPRTAKTAQKTAPKSIGKRAGRGSPIVSKALPRAVSTPLPPVPDTGLVQMTAIGPLPGWVTTETFDVYAKAFDRSQKRPRIGIVVTGLGLSDAATESAIQGLAGGVTLAFAPYSSKLNEWIRLARAGGHEVLINIPMEPVNYPAYDPGPQTLLTSLNADSNLDRLFWALSRATGYVGVVDFLGSRFTVSRTHMVPVLKALKQRGLMYLDSGSTSLSIAPAVARQIGMSFAASALTLDERASRKDID